VRVKPSVAPPAIRWTEPAHPLWPWLLRACVVATAAPLWSARYLPFTDLPQHAAAIATLRHWWDPAWKAQEYFTLALGQSNYLLYYVAGALLAVPCGSAERANVVMLSAVAVALPYSLRSLLRALGRDERLALFGAPLFWNQTLLIGFFNYLAALPLLLAGLSLAARQAQVPSKGRWAMLAVATVALFYLHLSAFVFFVPAAILGWWMLAPPGAMTSGPVPPPRHVRAALQLSWLAPALVLSLVWLARSPLVHPQSVGWTQPMFVEFEAPGAALRHLGEALLDIWQGPEGRWCLGALLASAALLAWPQDRAPEGGPDRQRRRLLAWWLATAVLFYFAFPNQVGWLWQLNERYAILAALLGPALLRPAPGVRGVAPLLLVAATACFAAGTAMRQVRAFDREVGSFDRVLSHAQPGQRLLGLIYAQSSRFAKFAPFLHFGSYYRARHGGVAEYSFARLPQSPLRYRPESAPPSKPAYTEWLPYSFLNSREGPYYDYVLVRGTVNPFARNPAGPVWRLVASEGHWALFERASPAR
jgi:hypothetical protein